MGLIVAVSASAYFVAKKPWSWAELAFEETLDEPSFESARPHPAKGGVTANQTGEIRASARALGKNYELKLDEELPPLKGNKRRYQCAGLPVSRSSITVCG